MNEERTPAPAAIDIAKVARAIRFAVAAIVLGLSFFSSRLSFTIPEVRRLASDLMVPGAGWARWGVAALQYEMLFKIVSILVPLAAIATLFDRKLARSFYVLGALSLITMAEFFLLCLTYAALMGEVTRAMAALGG